MAIKADDKRTGKNLPGKLTMKRPVLFKAILIMVLLAGCSGAVRHTLNTNYESVSPYTVAILPIEWERPGSNAAEVGTLFRNMSYESLSSIGYGPLALEEVDKLHARTGHGPIGTRDPVKTSALLGTDAVLYTRITGWESNVLVSYAYLNVAARFELYSKDGELLWRAEHKTRGSDIRLDKESIELAVVKAYEPRVQRLIDAVFSTLPAGQPPKKRKTFFDWLP